MHQDLNNIILEVSYDGTKYFGWQRTQAGPSIEEELCKVISQIVQHEVQLQAASRTDRGVHARGQLVNFFTPKKLNLCRFKKSVNGLLPDDIVLQSVEVAALQTFHPTLDAKGKEYHYHIAWGRGIVPYFSSFTWNIAYPLDLHLMQRGAQLLRGKHDFNSFCNFRKNLKYSHTVRNLFRLDIIEEEPERIRIELQADTFLYKMARNLVGTIVYCGLGKIDPKNLETIVKARHRIHAGITAPAHGLILHKVFY
jgi:tRNA pseudouridine38-40 synthase